LVFRGNCLASFGLDRICEELEAVTALAGEYQVRGSYPMLSAGPTAVQWHASGRPADRTLVYLVRHGKTPLNESGVLQGLLDPPLDEAGHQQARRLAAALGPQMPRAVVASPLLRATQTAQPIADGAGLKVATDERLLDRDYGQWTGTDREKVIAQWGSVDNAAGVEPPGAVRDRAVRGLTDIGQRSRGGTAVVISHDAVNRQVLVAFDPSTP
jgi:probable phosphoglycerate mutase